MVSDLYIQQIKAFKPTPLSAKEVESSVKAFNLPSAPAIPNEEISSELLNEYENSEVEVETVAQGATIGAEEDWFVFESDPEPHH